MHRERCVHRFVKANVGRDFASGATGLRSAAPGMGSGQKDAGDLPFAFESRLCHLRGRSLSFFHPKDLLYKMGVITGLPSTVETDSVMRIYCLSCVWF